jgi:hypothetical protein
VSHLGRIVISGLLFLGTARAKSNASMIPS